MFLQDLSLFAMYPGFFFFASFLPERGPNWSIKVLRNTLKGLSFVRVSVNLEHNIMENRRSLCRIVARRAKASYTNPPIMKFAVEYAGDACIKFVLFGEYF